MILNRRRTEWYRSVPRSQRRTLRNCYPRLWRSSNEQRHAYFALGVRQPARLECLDICLRSTEGAHFTTENHQRRQKRTCLAALSCAVTDYVLGSAQGMKPQVFV
jgi:hypothetical protein